MGFDMNPADEMPIDREEYEAWERESKLEAWNGVVRAIIDGHSCLPQESQEIILALIRNGKLIVKGVRDALDDLGGGLTEEEVPAVALFDGLVDVKE